MELTPTAVEREHAWVRERADVVVPILNDVRQSLGEAFDADVPDVTREEYRGAVDAVFADGDRAVNAAALVAILRNLDVQNDYPGFVVDELLGRELAGIIAGEQPLRLLAESTFHYADVVTDGAADARDVSDEPAGVDDLDAALAAGFQTRLPGWSWTEGDSPFSVPQE
ncbi:hypothetical protein [Halobacterium zhouii]|uniref:hypothetical protein n=1 Tax=Halobacterium zhouii TaxID=2902624 RepID=UPI001E321D03|nr:hypothetical protein [Halobacterium zhouii]